MWVTVECGLYCQQQQSQCTKAREYLQLSGTCTAREGASVVEMRKWRVSRRLIAEERQAGLAMGRCAMAA
jgi:hypothetical protein